MLLSVCLNQAQAAKKPTISGDIIRKNRGDTTWLYYDMEISNLAPDTVSITIDLGRDNLPEFLDLAFPVVSEKNRLIIYRRGDSLPFDNGVHRGYIKNGKYRFKGYIKAKKNPAFDSTYSEYSFFAEQIIDTDSISIVLAETDFNSETAGFDGSFLVPGIGYYHTDYPLPDKKESYLISYDFSLNVNRRKSSYNIGTSWTGLSSKFTFSTPVRFRYTYLTGQRTNWMPQLHGGLKVERIKFSNDDDEIFKSLVGCELGVSVEGRFERLSYYYTLTDESEFNYHTVELFTPLLSGGISKIGSQYKLKYQEKLLTVQLSFYLQGVDLNSMDHGGFDYFLFRRDDRNIFRKGIAYLSMAPYLPLILIGQAINAVDGKEHNEPPISPPPATRTGEGKY